MFIYKRMIIHHRRHLLRPQHVFEMANIFKYFEMCAYLVLTMGVWFGLTTYLHSLGHTMQNIYEFGQPRVLRNPGCCLKLETTDVSQNNWLRTT